MKKYEAYKNSGVEWIGEIPEGWSTNRIKFLFSFGRGLNITKADLTETGVPVISYGQIHSKQNTGTSIEEHLLRYVPEQITNEHQECKVKIGDFIFADTSEDKEGCGNCVYVDREGIFAGYHSLVVDGKGSDNKYFAYLFKSEDWRAQIRSKASGVKVFSITQSIMSNCSVLLPSKEEQRAIASYLDHKVGQIDASISAINTQIEDLKAFRQSVISETVTKGLNPNVAMKDSGIEWIGEIPTGWEVKKIKNIADTSTENSFVDGDWIESPYIEECGIRYITSGNIGSGVFKRQGNGFISDKTFSELKCKYAYAGDLVFSRLNSPYGRSCILPNEYDKYVIAVDNVILRTAQDKRYICYVTQCSRYEESVKMVARGTAMKRVSRTNLGDISLPIPPLSEQQAIASYLDAKTAKIDSTIKSLEAQRDDLNALKQSVISEAVTGKIDVRDWEPNNEQ